MTDGLGDLLDGGIARLARAVRRGEVTAGEVARAALERIAARDTTTNAVVHVAPDRVEEHLQRGVPSGPLAGVPFLVKDLHAEVDGLPLTRGSRLFAGAATRGTSALVARLEHAGAIALGRTATPELGLDITTEPVLHGPTRNPYDLERSAGGSSGGSAVAVASRMVPFAHASDSGGSIRVPAAWCGVVGLKPTRGVNPMGPWRRDDWSGLSHEHALTTSVADTRRLLEVTAGPLRGDPYRVERPDLRRRERSGLVVGLVLDAPGGDAADAVCGRAAVEAASALAGLGHRVLPVRLPSSLSAAGPTLATVIAGHLAATVGAHEAATGRRASPEVLEPAVWDLLERGRRTTAAEHVAAVDDVRRLGRDVEDVFDEVDLLLTPTTARPAPPLGALHTDRPAADLFGLIVAHAPFTMAWNLSGGPALSLPWGSDDGGVPIGVQLAGPAGHDALLLDVAEALEDARPAGRAVLPPPTVRSPHAA